MVKINFKSNIAPTILAHSQCLIKCSKLYMRGMAYFSASQNSSFSVNIETYFFRSVRNIIQTLAKNNMLGTALSPSYTLTYLILNFVNKYFFCLYNYGCPHFPPLLSSTLPTLTSHIQSSPRPVVFVCGSFTAGP